jgi:hypothetical protein
MLVSVYLAFVEKEKEYTINGIRKSLGAYSMVGIVTVYGNAQDATGKQ